MAPTPTSTAAPAGEGSAEEAIEAPEVETPSSGEPGAAVAPAAETAAEPEAAPEPLPAEPERPMEGVPDAFADQPTVDEVSGEPSYVETGTMGEDTTDDAWGSSVWDYGRAEQVAPAAAGAADSPPIQFSESTPDLPQATEQTYPSPTGAPPTEEGDGTRPMAGYTAPRDAPIAQGLYGDYGEFEGGAPPTEEVPASVLEDVGTSYNAPMNVPEPPPIPGILDRFTPPPVQRSGYERPQAPSGGASSALPDYLSGVDEGSDDSDSLPLPPGRRKQKPVAPPPKRSYDDDDDVGGPPMLLIVGGLGIGVFAIVALLGVAWVALGGMSGSGETAEGTDKEASPLEVRQDMTREPGLIGVEPKPQPEREPQPAPDKPDPVPDVPAPGPIPKAQPTPRPSPTPKPTPRPAPAAPKPAASVGTLKVEANRRVLIKVNGQPKGFTPQRLELPPGTYEVSAAMPGQADTEKKKTVTISGPGATVGVDFAF